MSSDNQERLARALARVREPMTGEPLAHDPAMSRLVRSDDGGWRALVVLPRAVPKAMAAELERGIAAALLAEGIKEPVSVALVADPTTAGPAAAAAAASPGSAASPSSGHRPMPGVGPGADEKTESGLSAVRAILAVASGKGGVGKSTVAVNLAVALADRGLGVGLMDADIYGPSAPVLLGLHGKPEVSPARRLVPLEAHGIKAMSMGFLLDPDKAAIWRGPMVAGAVSQLLHDVEWGALDVLVVDMPPGTGDAQLTLVQRARPTGAVIVSTPQDLALADARRAVQMFRRVEVPIIGIVENMSVFICPHCGGESAIFGRGGAEAEARRLGVPFLGAVPLEMAVRESADAGRPLVLSHPDSAAAKALRGVAESITPLRGTKKSRGEALLAEKSRLRYQP